MVAAGISILAGITVVAINPVQQLTRTRNYERLVSVNIIENAVYSYASDNDGDLPSGIPLGPACLTAVDNEICRDGADDCSGYIDLSVLTDDQRYLVSFPVDPGVASGSSGTGYRISRNTVGRISTCAPLAEDSEVIEVMR